MALILLVDNQPEDLFVLEKMLTPLGYKVFKAKDGTEALRILEKEEIDLVLSDVCMPEMDGLQLCEEIKKNKSVRNIPVVLLSAMKKEIDDMVTGLDSGADDYLIKPVERFTLTAKVRSMLRRKELNESLVEAEKKRTIALMAITANHEINNPLTGIIGNAKFLQVTEGLSREDLDKTCNVIIQQAYKISEVLKRFSTIIEPVKAKYIGIKDMIDLKKSKYTNSGE